MPKSSNSKKESNVKNKLQEEREGRSRGFVGLLKNIIKALFNSVVDLPQQEQYKNYNQQQEEQEGKNIGTKTTVGKNSKNLKDLDQKKVEEAAKGLKERLQKSDAGNQSAEIKVPNQTSVQDIDSSKVMER